jgi:hypothetical protein
LTPYVFRLTERQLILWARGDQSIRLRARVALRVLARLDAEEWGGEPEVAIITPGGEALEVLSVDVN